jgi:hypothetical protein
MDLAPGTIVNILPETGRMAQNFVNMTGWTVVGPTRHPYSVVVREPDYGTTVHVNVKRLEVVQ